MANTVFRNSYLYYLRFDVNSKPVCSRCFLADNDDEALKFAMSCEISREVSLYRFGRINEYFDACTVCTDFKDLGKVNCLE